MNWIILIVAGLFEVVFAFCLGKAKETTGNEMYLWYGGFLVALCISMGLLIKATQALPIGTAYAVWTGIGAVPFHFGQAFKNMVYNGFYPLYGTIGFNLEVIDDCFQFV
ncbi:multidrug efflux SMR transporter [Parapedobacter sp. 2B3]|uniref:DMT family transporter n=1 Tax=Parapedobacter sp. 2B3 TaxID=3342381 RepID=UPI0035B67CAD